MVGTSLIIAELYVLCLAGSIFPIYGSCPTIRNAQCAIAGNTGEKYSAYPPSDIAF